jgi:predicted RNA methylase
MNVSKKINPYVFPIKGDISRADVVVLYEMARKVNGPILEFGVGGSTIILAASTDGKVISVENELSWTNRTRNNLELYGLKHKVKFIQVDYKQKSSVPYKSLMDNKPELIYIDSLSNTRPDTFHAIFPLAAKGTEFLIHDCRNRGCTNMFMDIFKEHSNDIEFIYPCYRESNMFYIRKTYNERKYVNWNVEEAGNNRVEWGDVEGIGVLHPII